MIRAALAVLALMAAWVAPASRAGTPFDAAVAPELYTQILREHVVTVPLEDGAFETRFDYPGFLAGQGSEEFRRGLRGTFLSVDPASLGEFARLAWAINAYNFLVLDRVSEAYSDGLGSIGDLAGGDFAVFDDVRYTAAGREYSLNSFEAQFLFLNPDRGTGTVSEDIDPRIHFAIVCAALGCPPLFPEPFTAADLDAQLTAVTRNALANPRHLRVEDGRVRVGKIFEWYAADFQHEEGGMAGFLRRYGPANLPEGEFTVTTDLEWDWSLNRP